MFSSKLVFCLIMTASLFVFLRSVLNVAIAYSSRYELTEVVQDIAYGVKEGIIKKS